MIKTSRSNFLQTEVLKATPLNGLSIAPRTKVVSFARYNMLISFSFPIKVKQLHTDSQLGLFDASYLKPRVTNPNITTSPKKHLSSAFKALDDHVLLAIQPPNSTRSNSANRKASAFLTWGTQ